MFAFTDYPIKNFGDDKYKLAPIRECEVIKYDGDKYCLCIVEDDDSDLKERIWIKLSYIYEKYGRFGDVPTLNRKRLNEIS